MKMMVGITLIAVCTFAVSAQTLSTWRGPEANGGFPAKDVVTTCDEASGRNIVWKVPLPFIGCNSPVYANGRVFVLVDAGWDADAPQLICVDVNSGEMLWKAKVDKLDLFPPEQAGWARSQRRKEYQMARRSRELLYQLKGASDEAAKKRIVETAKAEGFAVRNDKGRTRFSITSCKMVFSPPHKKGQDYKRLNKSGMFWWEGWYYPGTIYTGQTMPSVVSDGKSVYVFTNEGVGACYDMKGRRRWMVDLRMPGGGHGGGPINTASPTLVGDTVIFFKYDQAVALSKNTGRELWRHKPKYRGAYQPGSAPVHFRLRDANYVYLTSSEILRVSDGKAVGKLDHPADLAGKERSHGPYFGAHSQSIARGDMIWVVHSGYGGGSGRALPGVFAFRLRKNGEKVTGKLLWQTENGRESMAIALDGDRLYVGKRRIEVRDPVSGKVLKENRRFAFRSPQFAVTDKYLLTLTHSRQKKSNIDLNYRGKGYLHWYDKTTLREVGKGTLLMDKSTPEVTKKRVARVAKPWWGWGSSSPTAWGNRIFVRSHDALYCIGDPNEPFRAPSEP